MNTRNTFTNHLDSLLSDAVNKIAVSNSTEPSLNGLRKIWAGDNMLEEFRKIFNAEFDSVPRQCKLLVGDTTYYRLLNGNVVRHTPHGWEIWVK